MSPFYERLPNVEGFGVEVTADTLGAIAVGAVAAAGAIHGVASAIRARRHPIATHDGDEVLVEAAERVTQVVGQIAGPVRQAEASSGEAEKAITPEKSADVDGDRPSAS
jgi:hydrogenase small subunit